MNLFLIAIMCSFIGAVVLISVPLGIDLYHRKKGLQLETREITQSERP
jgi:hypothetical protein